jgi:excisionase family DNA binding protein
MTTATQRFDACRCPAFAVRFSFLSIIATSAAHGEQHACEPPVLTLAEAAELLRIGADEMAELAQRNEFPGRRIGAEWRFNCASLLEWLNGPWTPTKAAEAAPAEPPQSVVNEAAMPLTPSGMADVTAGGPAAGSNESTPQASGPPDDDHDDGAPIGEAPEERTAEDILLRGQRVLLGPGEAVLDFGQFYIELDGQLLAPVDDAVVLATVERETLLTSLQGRIGFGDEMELFVGTTYFNQDSDAFFGNRKITSTDTSDFGSVSLGLRRTLMREAPGRPNMIGTLSASIPTGDTSRTLGGGLALVKSIDPVVLFATIGYTHVFGRESADPMRLEPEDRVDVGLGYALALNDTLALSMSISGAFTAATRSAGNELRQQDSYALRFGLTSWLVGGVYIEPSVSFNLGGPDDSFAFGLTVPYTLGR